jgi:uncharacterized protein
MREETLSRTIGQTFQYVREHRVLHEVDFIWHGGEPTVAGVPFFEKVIGLQQEFACGVKYRNSLQTNGVLINDRWISFLKNNGFGVSVSIDGPQAINDKHRVTYNGQGSFQKVFQAITRLKQAGIPFGACMVLSKATAAHAEEIFAFFATQRLPFNIIPMTRSGAARYRFDQIGLDANEYADAWIPMFDAWFAAGKTADYVYVQDFVLKTRAIAAGRAMDCIGMSNCALFNISTDPVGDVYPCASLSGNSEACYGNINAFTLAELLASRTATEFKTRRVDPQCASCKWQHVCHGGCMSRAKKFGGDINQRDYYCPSLYRIYEHIAQRLIETGIPIPGKHPLHVSDGLDHVTYQHLRDVKA